MVEINICEEWVFRWIDINNNIKKDYWEGLKKNEKL